MFRFALGFGLAAITLGGCVTPEDKPESCLSVVASFYTPKNDSELILPVGDVPDVGAVYGVFDPSSNTVRILCMFQPLPEMVALGCKEAGDLTGLCVQSSGDTFFYREIAEKTGTSKETPAPQPMPEPERRPFNKN